MTQPSLFKEVAQRIVQRAQSSENDSATPFTSRSAPTPGARASSPAQMTGSSFAGTSACGFTSPTDKSPAPHR